MDIKQEIGEFTGEYRFLSNFHRCKIEYEGLEFSSVEAAFQAAKSMDMEVKAAFQAYTPAEAKKAGRRIMLRPDWENVKVDILKQLLQIKFSDPELRKLLLATGSTELTEGNRWHDNFYGNCMCDRCKNIKGQNILGKLLMELRCSYSTNRYMGIHLDFSRLITKDDLLKYLNENGAAYRTLSDIRDKYEDLGGDLIWKYPLCDDALHAGTFIIPVQEGFLSVPYDEVDSDNYEILLTERACLVDAETLEFLQEGLRSYTDGFCNAMRDAINILRNNHQQTS